MFFPKLFEKLYQNKLLEKALPKQAFGKSLF